MAVASKAKGMQAEDVVVAEDVGIKVAGEAVTNMVITTRANSSIKATTITIKENTRRDIDIITVTSIAKEEDNDSRIKWDLHRFKLEANNQPKVRRRGWRVITSNTRGNHDRVETPYIQSACMQVGGEHK